MCEVDKYTEHMEDYLFCCLFKNKVENETIEQKCINQEYKVCSKNTRTEVTKMCIIWKLHV